jgi:catechol 2,3-dioxygenase-like lactoylglutathione lyase family enzyme
MKVKGISWVGVGVDDFDAALSFFTDVMGLRPAAVDERGVAILHVSEGQVLEIFGPDTKGHELNSPPVVAFEVEDVTQARDELLAHNVEVIGDIGSWNGFEWAYFRGPAGRVFSIKKTPPAGWEKNV